MAGSEPVDTAAPHNTDVPTDAGKVTITVVGGPHPYLWIGQDGDYLDSVDMAVIRKALRPRSRRAKSA